MLEAWDCCDDYFHDWDLFFKGIPEDSNDRFVYLGNSTLYEKLNTETFRKFWKRAEERVEALRQIDELKLDISRKHIMSLDLSKFTHPSW
jgi:hypothetical protein